MSKLYFFKSTNKKDSISSITILSSSLYKATKLAYRYFAYNDCKGSPVIFTV